MSAKCRCSRPARGFSLPELLAAMAILVVLATMAYPSYTAQIHKARRSAAATELMQLARALEKCFVVNASYLQDPDGDGVADCSVADSMPTRSGDYQVRVAPRTATRYTLTATVVAGGRQEGDAACTSLRLSSTGGKSATGSAPATCW